MNWNPERALLYRQAPLSRDKRKASAGQDRPVSDRLRVGIWDLNASAGALPRLLDEIDKCQSRFSFSSVEAPFQTGLTIPGAHVARDWYDHTGRHMDSELAQHNVAARPILAAAKPILKKLPISWLVVVVKSMISDTTDPSGAWHNLFSTHSDHIILISTFELREYAARAGRSFEAAVLGVALSALLAAMVPKIEYQSTSTGSIFDFCENRADIVKSIRDPQIDPENRARIPQRLLEPTERILQVLTQYEGRAPEKVARARRENPMTLKKPSEPPAPAAAATPLESPVKAFADALKSLNATLAKSSAQSQKKPSVRARRSRQSARRNK